MTSQEEQERHRVKKMVACVFGLPLWGKVGSFISALVKKTKWTVGRSLSLLSVRIQDMDLPRHYRKRHTDVPLAFCYVYPPYGVLSPSHTIWIYQAGCMDAGDNHEYIITIKKKRSEGLLGLSWRRHRMCQLFFNESMSLSILVFFFKSKDDIVSIELTSTGVRYSN